MEVAGAKGDGDYAIAHQGMRQPDDVIFTQYGFEEWGSAEFGDREDFRDAIRDPIRIIVTHEGWKFVCSPQEL